MQPLNQLHCFQQHNSTATPPTIRAYYSLVVSAYFPKLNTELRKYPPILCSDFIQKQAWERTHPFKNCVIPSVPYYTHIHTYTYSTYIRKYIHTYVHIYIYTYIRIYIHTYIHTYILFFGLSSTFGKYSFVVLPLVVCVQFLCQFLTLSSSNSLVTTLFGILLYSHTKLHGNGNGTRKNKSVPTPI